MSAGVIIAAAYHVMGGTIGEMCAALERKKAVGKPQVMRWIKRLRAAADQLERLL